MASKSLGTLTIDLVAKVGGFEQGLSKAERELDKRAKRMNDIAKKIGVGIGTAITAGIAGGAVAAGALALITKQAINAADEMRDLSIRVGESTETLSVYGYAASQTGTDIDTLAKGLKVLSKNVADGLNPTNEYAKVFAALGLTLTDNEGRLRKLGDLIPEIADRFKSMEDGTTKAALAQSLFGRAGLDLTEFLNQGSEGIAEFTQKAQDLGIVIDGETAAAADNFNDQLGDLKQLVGALGLQVAKELLPRLNSLVESLVDVVREGSAAEKIASGIGTAFDIAAKSATVVSATFKGVAYDLTAITLAAVAAGKALGRDFLGAASFLKQAADFRKMAAEQSDRIEQAFGPDFGNVKDGTERWKNVVSGSSSGGVDEAALALALSNPTKSSGKSDAEKQAERLARAINRMTDAQRKWETELAGTGNPIADDYANRLAQITEKAEDFKRNGIPVERVAQFTEEMRKLALAIKDKELAEFQKEFDFQTKEMVNSVNDISNATIRYERALLELGKTLKSGVITQGEYQSRLDAIAKERDSAAIGLLRDLRDESTLLGMSSDQQEIWNNLKWAGVSADSEWGRQIIESTRALQGQSESMSDQIEAMDAVRDAGKGLFRDLIDGNKSWKDSFTDALDSIQDRILDMIAENWMDQLFGKQGDPAGGSTGGWFSSLLGAFFGGGKASGGGVQSWSMQPVNEYRPELLTVGGKDYLMMGAQSGHITPKPSMGGSVSVTQNFMTPGMIDRRTATQQRQLTAQGLQIATARR